MGQKQNKKKTEGVTGLGRITSEQIKRWKQTRALRLQTSGGRHLKRPAFLHGPKERRSLREDFEDIKYRLKDRKMRNKTKEKKQTRYDVSLVELYRMPGGVIVGDSGLCCCVPVQCVTSIVRAQLLPFIC